MSKDSLTMRQCTDNDLETLHQISCKTYYDTFHQQNTVSNMMKYLDQAFDLHKLRRELQNRNSLFYFLYSGEQLAGYIKLNDFEAQTDVFDRQSLEIERIYVKKEFFGKGMGSILLNKAIQIATEHQKTYLWLGVWEENQKAIAFYKRNGFYPVGKHSFFMGDDEQTDVVMRKDL